MHQQVTWSDIDPVYVEDFIGLYSDTGISMLNKSCGFTNSGSGIDILFLFTSRVDVFSLLFRKSNIHCHEHAA